ncbi:hypothetical protein JR316_0013163 [Psilocybe cubensis]|uniref:Uncharacterized protein n=2 Tax=Psilocybe cubensis TaxID=181762 RepID=A0ACB8GGH8_PSICU|nr:hypothetical protein JR316_0013163 [Psilocybe cubensis]KAH9474698.1 hypothetical protein JR316_0013163 [Psilocybe cubensis]
MAGSFDLPAYHSTTSLPGYSSKLSDGEQLLEYTPHRPSYRRPSSVYIRKEGRTTVVLNNQKEGTAVPQYGRQGTINGTICFENSDNILEVIMEIQGTMDIFVSQAGYKSLTIFEVSYPLWSPLSPDERQTQSCPSQIAFSKTLHTTFNTEDGRTLPLPPTYSSPRLHLAGPQAMVSYELRIIIKCSRHPKLAAWTKTRRISIPFQYVPRTRAHQPITSYSSFPSSIKSTPEEWHQTVVPIPDNQGREKLYGLLFLPGHRIYGLGDIIPFHVQLTGDTEALQELLPSVRGSMSSSLDPRESSSRAPILDHARIEVVLLRQVTVRYKLLKSWEDTVIGKGIMWWTFPEVSSKFEDRCCIDWDGELRCQEGITVGGFDAGNIHVKDFLVLKIIPTHFSCPVQTVRSTVPIRLVTDSFDGADF